jgi:outer membrane protein assembly factor BamD
MRIINLLATITVIPSKLAHTTFICLIGAMFIALSGCATTGEEEDLPESKTWPVDKLYSEAKNELKAGDYQLAIEYFETLQARFPFGRYALQAQLEAAYGYYLYEEYDSAIAAADRFIRLHPKHPKVDYAYYLRGLAAFHKNDSPLDSLAEQDPSSRDPTSSRESFNFFAQLVTNFPKSKFVPDAIKRMKYQRNTLARHELRVANYYMQRGAFVAVVNRAKYIISNYPRTPAIPSAIVLLKNAYKKLEMFDLAEDSARLLNRNFPNYEDSKHMALIDQLEE